MSQPHSFSELSSNGSHLRVDGLSFAFANHRVLTDISFIVSSGDRVGLIGENGSGKSTLLRVIAGLLPATAGHVSVNALGAGPSHVGLLHQEPPFAPTDSITEALESAVAAARTAAIAVEKLGIALAENPEDSVLSSQFAQALEDTERLSSWDTDARISAMLSGLGLSSIEPDRTTNSLSGGQRARLALAWLLLSTPQVLLLDEPSNHLDDTATSFLVEVLKSWRGPVMMASHDRAFLDDAATSLIDLDPSPIPHTVAGALVQDGTGTGIGARKFTGTYSDYLRVREEEKLRWELQYRDEQALLSKLRSRVRDQQNVGHVDWKPRTESRIAKKFYGDRNAKVVSRRVNDARSRLEELEKMQIRKPPASLSFQGLTAGGRPQQFSTIEPVLAATNISVTHRLAPVNLSISRGEKWLITGANGAGKSTLLQVLAGSLVPDSGHVWRSGAERVGLLSQDVQLLDPYGRGTARTVSQTYEDLVGVERAQSTPLDTFGLLAGRDNHRPVNALSLGQQRRLALAVLLANPPEILLLDEPTNHFSLGLVTALEQALTSYPGTVLIASHDRWLRQRWPGEHLSLGGPMLI